MALPPVDIVIRCWFDRPPELISPVDDWIAIAAMNHVLDSYVVYELTAEEEE